MCESPPLFYCWKDYNIAPLQFIISFPAKSSLKMHWKSPVRGRGEVCRWKGREESGLQMRQSGGVRDERDTVCACVTEFSHLDGQLARPIPLTDRAPSPYLRRGVSNFLLAISIWELRSCACVTFESWSNRDCFKGSYFPQHNGLVLFPTSPPLPAAVTHHLSSTWTLVHPSTTNHVRTWARPPPPPVYDGLRVGLRLQTEQ